MDSPLATEATPRTALVALGAIVLLLLMLVSAAVLLVSRHAHDVADVLRQVEARSAPDRGADRNPPVSQPASMPADGARRTIETALDRTDNRAPLPMGNPADWFSDDTYPPYAKQRGLEGRVAVTLRVEADGTVSDCSVRESSGVQVLDLTTCAAAIRFGRFRPAHDPDGKAIAGDYRLPTVRWQLGDE